ncbi:MAG: exodeoxyribonuclease VII large subunit [Deltaproteobacteria bacterium]|nr:exodeoxyribonuclease VII large subunit [Deltaproteobacteria bacterium]
MDLAPGTNILSVSQLNSLISDVIDETFGFVWVEGEVSNLRIPASGHSYFTLKDAESQIRVVLFRGAGQSLQFDLKDGQKVICLGKLSLYKQRGEYQVIAEHMEPSGLGSLHLAFEQLKKKLEGEGLFEAGKKKPLPSCPKKIGIVTSPTGAAIKDILNVLERRNSTIEVVISPTAVQGEKAPREIAAAIEALNELGNIDVIIAGRGGGSLEDLWAFNEEIVARAIHASAIPVISAVGHERDYCISDFVSDLRAPTPSAAAEIVARSASELSRELLHLRERMELSINRILSNLRNRVEREKKLLIDPGKRLSESRMRIDDLAFRLERRMRDDLQLMKSGLRGLAGKLDSLSPLAVLSRGYSIATDLSTGKVILDSKEVSSGSLIGVRLFKGELECRVENKK